MLSVSIKSLNVYLVLASFLYITIVLDYCLLPIVVTKLNIQQNMLGGDTAVIAETGDSWFNCQKLRLPENCG